MHYNVRPYIYPPFSLSLSYSLTSTILHPFPSIKLQILMFIHWSLSFEFVSVDDFPIFFSLAIWCAQFSSKLPLLLSFPSLLIFLWAFCFKLYSHEYFNLGLGFLKVHELSNDIFWAPIYYGLLTHMSELLLSIYSYFLKINNDWITYHFSLLLLDIRCVFISHIAFFCSDFHKLRHVVG